MSLINQMLRDLEQRDRPSVLSSPADPTHIPLMRDPVRPKKPFRTWTIALVTCVAAGWLIWDRVPVLISDPEQPAANTEFKKTSSVEKLEPEAISTKPNSADEAIAIAESPIEQTHAPQETQQELELSPASPALADQQSPTPPIPAVKTQPPAKTSLPRTKNKTGNARQANAEALYRQADNSASRMMRKENLKEVLDIDPYHLPARQKLLSLLLQERSTLELKRFLDDSLALFPTHLGFITSLAHYYVQQKDYANAISTLERLDQFTVDDTHYLGLLAASYQQQQLYNKALPIYQRLSQIQADKAENWLGLGICADKLQFRSRAAQAYRRALQENSLSSEVVDYIKQRLSALN